MLFNKLVHQVLWRSICWLFTYYPPIYNNSIDVCIYVCMRVCVWILLRPQLIFVQPLLILSWKYAFMHRFNYWFYCISLALKCYYAACMCVCVGVCFAGSSFYLFGVNYYFIDAINQLLVYKLAVNSISGKLFS